MKTIHQIGRRQIALAACATCLLAAIAIIPWRLVAQERPAADPARPAAVPQDPRQPTTNPNRPTADPTQPAAPAKAAAEVEPKEKSALEKLLIGTWRGKDLSNGATSEWVFQKDGTYQQLLVCGQNPQPFGGRNGEANYFRELGKWRIVDGMLAIAPKFEPSLLRGLVKFDSVMLGGGVSALGAAPGGDPAAPVAAPYGATTPEAEGRFKIVRLDDSLMRLQPVVPRQPAAEPDWVPMGSVTFCHRVDPKEAPADFEPSLPARLKEIATLARLTPKDASRIAPSFAEKDPQSGEPLHWDLIGRIVNAKNGKTDFAELFDLQPGEARAYNELLKLVGSYGAAWKLADDGQLAAQERSALDKLDSVRKELNAIRGAVGNTIADLQTRFGGTPFGPAELQASAKSLAAKEEFEAKMKLKLFLDELDAYLNVAVYASENLLGAPPPGVAGYGGAAAVPAPPQAVPDGRLDHNLVPGESDPRSPGEPSGLR